MLVTAAIGVLLAIGLSTALFRNITTPLQIVAHAVHQLAEGNLTFRTHSERFVGSELGDAAN